MTRLALLAVLSIIGIAGMLLADGALDWFFLALAALPVLLGAGLILARRIRRDQRE